jgi:hypothetical protein
MGKVSEHVETDRHIVVEVHRLQRPPSPPSTRPTASGGVVVVQYARQQTQEIARGALDIAIRVAAGAEGFGELQSSLQPTRHTTQQQRKWKLKRGSFGSESLPVGGCPAVLQLPPRERHHCSCCCSWCCCWCCCRCCCRCCCCRYGHRRHPFPGVVVVGAGVGCAGARAVVVGADDGVVDRQEVATQLGRGERVHNAADSVAARGANDDTP